MNYEFNRSCLAEKRIFLAHHQTLTYLHLQSSCRTEGSRLPLHLHLRATRPMPFSFRSVLSPSRNTLVIGSQGLGRSCLVKYLAKNSYFPFIMLFTDRLRDDETNKASMVEVEDNHELDVLESGTSDFDSFDVDYEYSDDDGLDDDDLDDIGDIDADFDFDMELWITMMGAPTIYRPRYMKVRAEEIVPFDAAFQLELVRLEFAKAMSHCIIWIPNIHDMSVGEKNYLSLGILEKYIYEDCEGGSTRNFLVIASTHIPKKLDPGLIAPNKFNTCIKMQKPLIPQRRKHFFILSYTKGFHLEKKMFHTNEFGSLTPDPCARDLVALTNEVLSISLAQRKSIIDMNTIRFALHRQFGEYRFRVRPAFEHGAVFYQIGRAVAQNVFLGYGLSNCPIDPISMFLRKSAAGEGDSYLSKWYFELGMSMKRLTILLYLLNCSAGSVAQDLWSTLRPRDPRLSALFRFGRDDSDLINSLLELEVALVGSSRAEKDCSQFDNDQRTLLLRSEPRNPLYMIQNGSCCIMDQKAFLYQKEGESGFEEKGKSQFEEDYAFWSVKEQGARSRLRDMEERNFFTNIIGSPRIWHPGFHLFDFFERIDELEFPYWAKSFWDRWPLGEEPEPDVFALFQLMLDRARKEYSEEEDEEDELDASEYSQGEIMQYGVRNRFFKDKGFWRISQFFWNPPEPSVFVFSDSALRVSHRELFADEEEEMLDFHSESDSEIVLRALGLDFQLFCMPKWRRKSLRIRWFRRDEDRDQNKARFELLIYRQRQRRFRNKSSLFTNSSLFKGSFHSYTRFESYRYLSNLFLSNGTLLDQMIKALCRKGWIFPEEMKHAIRVSII